MQIPIDLWWKLFPHYLILCGSKAEFVFLAHSFGCAPFILQNRRLAWKFHNIKASEMCISRNVISRFGSRSQHAAEKRSRNYINVLCSRQGRQKGEQNVFKNQRKRNDHNSKIHTWKLRVHEWSCAIPQRQRRPRNKASSCENLLRLRKAA